MQLDFYIHKSISDKSPEDRTTPCISGRSPKHSFSFYYEIMRKLWSNLQMNKSKVFTQIGDF